MPRRIINWLDHRTGIEGAVKSFFYEEIPASSGWHQVFGSVALFCFMTQALTGMLLSFNYAPTPGEAYNSLRYIITEVMGGKLIRGLHHFGASMTVVVVVLHMAQVFLYGAYKKPREATWLVGIVLLLLTLGFGLTGYLLPWDNRAYWGTVVTTQIAAKAPAGQYVSRLMGADGGVGVVTFARFYALHVMLLPLVTIGLIALHIVLVRRHGVAPLAGDNLPKKKFYPEQVFKDTVAVFLAFSILFFLAAFVEAPLGRLADPTDTSYIPRPEWYFLFLFQTLKFFEGPLEIVGSVVLPGLAMGLLAAVPFLDRGEVKRVTQRTFAGLALLLAAAGWGSLTLAAIATTPKTADEGVIAAEPQVWEQLSPPELAGIGYFRSENCISCHKVGSKGQAIGPDITQGRPKRDAKALIEHFRQPAQMVPGTSMPAVNLNNQQLSELAAFLLKLTPRNAEALDSAPDPIVQGAMVYQQQHCNVCHEVNGVGMKNGPPLNGVAQRREKQWLIDHFKDPKKMSPGSTMPPYNFNDRDMDRITQYLLAIPAKFEPPAE